MRAFTPKGWTRPILTSDNPNLKDWRRLVADAAAEVATGELFEGAIVLSLVFYLPKPKSASRSVVYPTKRPDLSKLIRSTEDALKGVLWVDDAQVVDLLVRKRYAGLGAPTGVFVTIEEPGIGRVPTFQDTTAGDLQNAEMPTDPRTRGRMGNAP